MKNKMVDELIKIAKQNQLRPEAMCAYLGISIATWNRWIAGKCFTNQYDRLNKVHDFIQHTEKYIKSA